MLIATLAIAGIPGLSGFFSKDEILWKAFSSEHGHPILWVIGFATAGLTAFYMFRLVYLTFHGNERMDEHTKHHIHESPKAMTVPLMVLAVLSVIGGWVGIPHIFGVTNYFEHWLEPVVAVGRGHDAASEVVHTSAGGYGTGMEIGLMAASVVLVLIAIFLAFTFYNKRTELATAWREKLSGLHKVLLNKYYVDEIYHAVVVRPLIGISIFLWKFVDVMVIDGIANGSAFLYQISSEGFRKVQTGRVRSYATAFVVGVVVILAYLVAD